MLLRNTGPGDVVVIGEGIGMRLSIALAWAMCGCLHAQPGESQPGYAVGAGPAWHPGRGQRREAAGVMGHCGTWRVPDRLAVFPVDH